MRSYLKLKPLWNQMAFQADDLMLQALDRVAAENDVTRSEVIRACIRKALNMS